MTLKTVILAIVGLILLCSVTLPILDNFEGQRIAPVESDWQYDDYKPVPSASSVSGPLEIITIQGTKYVHATGVGDGSITFPSGSTQSISVMKADLDLFLALGQSNNDYVAHDASTAAPLPPLGTTYYFGAATFPSGGLLPDFDVCSFQTLYDSDGALKVSNKIPAFGEEYHKYSGHKLYYVSAACSGTSITQWQPGEECWGYAEDLLGRAINAVDTDLFNLHIRGYTWAQGENDAEMTIAQYTQYFDTLNDAILDGDLGAEIDHCFMIRVRANFVNPWLAQTEIAEHNSTVTMASTLADTFTVKNGGLLGDRLHYSQSAQNEIGVELGDCASAYYFPDSAPMRSLSSLLDVLPIMIILAIVTSIMVVFFRARNFN